MNAYKHHCSPTALRQKQRLSRKPANRQDLKAYKQNGREMVGSERLLLKGYKYPASVPFSAEQTIKGKGERVTRSERLELS